MPSALFVCTHNSARSQMAEAYLKKFGGGAFDVESAGLEGEAQPVCRPRSPGGGPSARRQAADRCPIFPGRSTRFQWSYPDPSTFTGTDQEIMNQVREVRDAIREKIKEFLEKAKTGA
jgi:arsenate reductase (thioredoxin)